MAVMSGQVSNRTLESNTTAVLDDGEYRISSGPPCDVSNEGKITIKGVSDDSQFAAKEKKGECFNCGIHGYLQSHCKFQNSATYDGGAVVFGGLTGNVSITQNSSLVPRP